MTDATQLDNDVKRYLELDAMKADLEAEQSIIKARLRGLGEGKYDAPCGVAVTIRPNRRFNPAKAEEIVPAELIPAIQTLIINSKKAKALLPPALYEASMVAVGDPRVVIK